MVTRTVKERILHVQFSRFLGELSNADIDLLMAAGDDLPELLTILVGNNA